MTLTPTLPFLQKAFSTVSLTFRDWLFCAAVASSVLWLRELSKLLSPKRKEPRIDRDSSGIRGPLSRPRIHSVSP
ncbi:MAG: hypothetical protein SV598_09225 [Pseudomonadota bacterium]|nr:hypothetical protein [Pseudomonadota bacterium]